MTDKRREDWDGREGDYVRAGAVFTNGDAHRIRLWRYWRIPTLPMAPCALVFLMLNPSSATAQVLDPTVRRCVARARREGYDGCEVVNVFSLRATNPQDMIDSAEAGVDPEGRYNRAAILEACHDRRVILAFGANKLIPAAMKKWVESGFWAELQESAHELMCLRTTKAGWPEHPLYLPDALEAKPWRMP